MIPIIGTYVAADCLPAPYPNSMLRARATNPEENEMDFQLSTEQRMLQESTKKMVDRHIQPVLSAFPADRPLPKEQVKTILQLLAREGLTACRIPESAGGSALSALNMGLMFEQLPPVIAFAVLAQDVTVSRIYMGSTPEQRERLLPDLISARKITCTGATEPDTGSDPRGIKTRATEDGDSLVVTGRKLWISNASICDVINTTASVGQKADGLSRVIRVVIDREDSPFEANEVPVLGLKQGHLGEVVFDQCRVPKANQLGAEDDASRILTLTWMINRPLVGLFGVHLAQKAFDMALKYSGERIQFGRTIGGFQLVQELLADIAMAVTTSRLLCYYALSCIDRGERANHISAMAKRYSLTACQRAISQAMEVHGAMGISQELGLEQLYRDVRMLPIPDGTNQILTLIEGRELTGVPAYRV